MDTVVFIRSMAYFGDQLTAYPLLYQLKKMRPEKTIRIVAHDPVEGFYEGLPWVDDFVRADTFSEKYRAIPKQAGLVIALHHSSEKYGLLTGLRRTPLRLGFKNKRMSDIFWTHTLDKNINEYIGLSNLNLLRSIHDFDPQEAARGCMAALATDSSSDLDYADVVFMPGGGAGEFKRWSLENYLALAGRLKEFLGPDTTFGFILGPAEESETAVLKSVAREDFRLYVSRPVADIASVVLNSRLVVANDCGPSHLAQNTCGPYVGLFNEANPEWFWARGNSAAIIPDDGTIDIQSISVQRVLDACRKVLDA